MRKSLKERQRKIEMENQISGNKKECVNLEHEIESMNIKLKEEEKE